MKQAPSLKGIMGLDSRDPVKPILAETSPRFSELEKINFNEPVDFRFPTSSSVGSLELPENLEKPQEAIIREQKVKEREIDVKGSAAETMIGGLGFTGLMQFGLIAPAKLLLGPFLIGRVFRMLDLENENKISRGEEPKNLELIKVGKAISMTFYFLYGLKTITPILIPLHIYMWQYYIIMGIVAGVMYGLYKLGRHAPSLYSLYKGARKSNEN